MDSGAEFGGDESAAYFGREGRTMYVSQACNANVRRWISCDGRCMDKAKHHEYQVSRQE